MKEWFSFRNKVLFFSVLIILVLDQITKIYVHSNFILGETVSVIKDFFNLTYVQNTGAAFGMLADAHPSFRVPFFILVPMIALGVIVWIFKKIPQEEWRMSTALALVVSGAIGNLIDRIRLGFVIDFFDFHWKYLYHFPAFNIADSAICVGVGILMLDLFVKKPEENSQAQSV
jgi:signal peptidase II